MAYTEQQTFDMVTKHLLFQAKRSALSNVPGDKPDCLYRGPNGLKCAAGCLIPDEKYDSNLEGLSADHHMVAEILYEEGHNVDLVRQLQAMHDEDLPEAWPQRLEEIAQEWHLVNSFWG